MELWVLPLPGWGRCRPPSVHTVYRRQFTADQLILQITARYLATLPVLLRQLSYIFRRTGGIPFAVDLHINSGSDVNHFSVHGLAANLPHNVHVRGSVEDLALGVENRFTIALVADRLTSPQFEQSSEPLATLSGVAALLDFIHGIRESKLVAFA